MLYHNDFQKILDQVYLYYDMGRYMQSLDKIDQLLSQQPNDSHVLFIRASCLFHLDKNQEAIDYCSQAMMYGYSPCECNYLFGRIYLDLDQYIKSEEHFLAALAEDPLRADIMAVYGYLMLKTGIEKKAAKLMEEAMRIDPDNETVLHYKFYYHLAKDKREDQIAILERYLQTSSSQVRKLINVGMMALQNNQYKEAEENFKQAFLLDPTNENMLSILQDTEKNAHILFLPNRIINKMHGPVTIVIVTFTICIVLMLMNLTKAASIVIMIYIGLCIYTWIAPVIYKVIKKKS